MHIITNRRLEGDKMHGIWEMGKEIPYDFKALSEERQKVRDRINELQEQIASLPEEEVEVEEQVIVTNIEE